MLATTLVSLGAAIIGGLGIIHLVYTFRGAELTPRDPALQARMREVSPVLTSRTTMWKTWIGFNASHSLGALLFGLVYGYLALTHPTVLFRSPFLVAVGFGLLGSYALLGKRYWFSAPFRCIVIALACYTAGIAVGVVQYGPPA